MYVEFLEKLEPGYPGLVIQGIKRRSGSPFGGIPRNWKLCPLIHSTLTSGFPLRGDP